MVFRESIKILKKMCDWSVGKEICKKAASKVRKRLSWAAVRCLQGLSKE